MDAKRRNHRDFLQNIIISLLSLSAVILIAQTQIYSLGDSSDYFQQFLGGNSEETNPAVQSVSLSSPCGWQFPAPTAGTAMWTWSPQTSPSASWAAFWGRLWVLRSSRSPAPRSPLRRH